jgi:hypothetical protein
MRGSKRSTLRESADMQARAGSPALRAAYRSGDAHSRELSAGASESWDSDPAGVKGHERSERHLGPPEPSHLPRRTTRSKAADRVPFLSR